MASVAKPSILVIDDEDYVADLIASSLRAEGYAVAIAYNGRDGLRRALESRPGLIIADIMMPYLNGEDLVARLRAVEGLEEAPVLLISAGARPRQAAPHVTFMSKPFDIEDLLSAVSERIAAP